MYDVEKTANKSFKDRSNKFFFVRFYWLVIGNALLFTFTIAILTNIIHSPKLTAVLYWITAGSLILARLLDIFFFNGQTADDKPATFAHWVRYALKICILSVVLWFAAIAGHGLLAKLYNLYKG